MRAGEVEGVGGAGEAGDGSGRSGGRETTTEESDETGPSSMPIPATHRSGRQESEAESEDEATQPTQPSQPSEADTQPSALPDQTAAELWWASKRLDNLERAPRPRPNPLLHPLSAIYSLAPEPAPILYRPTSLPYMILEVVETDASSILISGVFGHRRGLLESMALGMEGSNLTASAALTLRASENLASVRAPRPSTHPARPSYTRRILMAAQKLTQAPSGDKSGLGMWFRRLFFCCWVACCPPCPSSVIHKIIFMPPPGKSYGLVGSDGLSVTRSNIHKLAEKESLRFRFVRMEPEKEKKPEKKKKPEKEKKPEEKRTTEDPRSAREEPRSFRDGKGPGLERKCSGLEGERSERDSESAWLTELRGFLIKTGRRRALAGVYLPCERARALIVFLHANATDLGWVVERMEQLRRKLHCSVVSYDYAGYGLSTGPRTEKAFYQDLEAFFARLRCLSEVERGAGLVVVGFSLGSVAATRLAARHGDEVRAVVLAGSFLSVLNCIRPRPSPPPFRCSCLDAFCAHRDLVSVHVPTMLVHGLNDPITQVGHAFWSLSQLRKPLRAHFLPDTGHNDLLEKTGALEALREAVDEAGAPPVPSPQRRALEAIWAQFLADLAPGLHHDCRVKDPCPSCISLLVSAIFHPSTARTFLLPAAPNHVRWELALIPQDPRQTGWLAHFSLSFYTTFHSAQDARAHLSAVASTRSGAAKPRDPSPECHTPPLTSPKPLSPPLSAPLAVPPS